MNIKQLNEELAKVLNETTYSNLDAIVWDINKILVDGSRATLKRRVPKDLKEDGVEFVVEIKRSERNGCLYQWGIYPDNEFLLCNWRGGFTVKQELEPDGNPEGYDSCTFVNQIFEKYGYKWVKE